MTELVRADGCVPIVCAVAAEGAVLKLGDRCFPRLVPGVRAGLGDLGLQEREPRATN